ncbi:putative RNA-directed DNA polymerase from transposon BS [Araneus ventricosus]|uniref:Putative RNA-directed DNA polymerase from transposon BS n=1 Tax=Araneus ventricosus TaxID=182803 RepID=A0A4Y2H0A2_ARAVE|nr:putative RNA-directed DNA polymerase from transposon BS [Araneus ventricosus]
MVFALTEIINNIFNFNYFPNAWKTVVVVPILKPGKDPTIPENCRPISLLSTLSKITEKFILDKLNEHLIRNKILCPEPFGFRKSLTTNHQLLRVVEYFTKGFNRDKCTAAVFPDIQKAFDRVWKQGLIHKLIMYKTPPHLVQLLNSYLDDRKFVVRIGNSSSESKTMKAGIPQGGGLSPVLYSIYVNDFPTTHKTLLGMYADDTAILARNKNPKYTAAAINQHLEKLDDWAIPVSISLHPVLFITPCRVLPKPRDVPDQQTSLVRFLIEELGVPPITTTTIQQDSQPVNYHPFPCFRIQTRTTKVQQHKSSSLQLVIPGIRPLRAMGPKMYSVVRCNFGVVVSRKRLVLHRAQKWNK